MATKKTVSDESALNSNYSQDDISVQGKKAGGRLKVKRFSVQEELLPVFWLSGSAALGRDDKFDQIVSPWRRTEKRKGLDGLPYPLPPTVVPGRPPGAGGGAGGRRYSRQLEIVPSDQRRKSDAARRSASSAAAVSVAALAGAMAGSSSDGGKRGKQRDSLLDAGGSKDNNRLLLPAGAAGKAALYDDVFLKEFEGDSLLFEQLGAGRRDSRQFPVGGRASQSSAPAGRNPRVGRGRKIVTVVIIVGVGLVVLSLLLVTVVLRLNPPTDSESVRKEQEQLMKKTNQGFVFLANGSDPYGNIVSDTFTTTTASGASSTSTTPSSVTSTPEG